MDEVRQAQIKRDALHYMLQVAFIEIRAADSLNAARKFSDVFHGLPMGLARCSSCEDYDAEFARLLERGRRWGLEDYLQNLRTMATQSVAENSG
jgi:hypothetical protein